MVTVHRRVAVELVTVTEVNLLVEDAIFAVPLTTVQTPEPMAGAVAFIVNVLPEQFDWSAPALAVGATSIVIVLLALAVQPFISVAVTV